MVVFQDTIWKANKADHLKSGQVWILNPHCIAYVLDFQKPDVFVQFYNDLWTQLRQFVQVSNGWAAHLKSGPVWIIDPHCIQHPDTFLPFYCSSIQMILLA